jgi:predicted nucleic acid-binding protein
MRFLYDTNVFVYAVGGESAYREPCRRILVAAERHELEGEASVDLVQELVHQRYRQTGQRSAAARIGRRIASACVLHALRPDDLRLALTLFEQGVGLGARDASFAAVALNRGLDRIVRAVRAVDHVPVLTRVDPADEAAVAALAE